MINEYVGLINDVVNRSLNFILEERRPFHNTVLLDRDEPFIPPSQSDRDRVAKMDALIDDLMKVNKIISLEVVRDEERDCSTCRWLNWTDCSCIHPDNGKLEFLDIPIEDCWAQDGNS